MIPSNQGIGHRSIGHVTYRDTVGFHYQKDVTQRDISFWAAKSNVHLIGGYLPLVSLVVAVNRIYQAVQALLGNRSEVFPDNLSPEQKKFCYSQIARGVAEFLGLGLLLLVVDCVATCFRAHAYEARNKPPVGAVGGGVGGGAIIEEV